MNRAVAVAAASIDAVNAVHASVIQERKERRGIAFAFAAARRCRLGWPAGAGVVTTGFEGAGSSLLYSWESPVNKYDVARGL